MAFQRRHKRILSLVSNGQLTLFEVLPDGEAVVHAAFPFDEIVSGEPVSAGLSAYSAACNDLLVVPDFWLASNSYLVDISKKSLLELFLRKKLRGEHPELPLCEHFFDYVPHISEQGIKGVQAYYFQDPQFSQLYQRLEECALVPGRITTPGLLWEHRLKSSLPDFDDLGVFLVNLVGSECFFYFFNRGRYLFSRDLSISNHLEAHDRIDAISYEIDQSRFLFSQRAKTQVDRICLVTLEDESLTAADFSRRLRVDVHDLDADSDEALSSGLEDLSAILHFASKDLLRSDEVLNLAHRQVRQEQEWRPVQNTGLVVGVMLLLVLLGQTLYLSNLLPAEWFAVDPVLQREQKGLLNEYGKQLDLQIKESRRGTPHDLMARVAGMLPEGMRLESLAVGTVPRSSVSLQCLVRADGPDSLRSSLLEMTRGVESVFSKKIGLGDPALEFEAIGEADDLSRFGDYRLKLKFELP